MVEYVGVIRKEVVSAMTPSGPQLQYTMGDKSNPVREFTAETFAPQAAEVAVTGKRRAAARGLGTKTPDFTPPDSMTATQMYNTIGGAKRGARFANKWQRRGQGLGAALGGLAGMISLANAGAQGQDLMSGALSAGQTGKFVSDAVGSRLGNVAGDVGGRVGVATHKPTKAPAGGTDEGYISAGGKVPNEIEVGRPIAGLLPAPGETSAQQPFTRPVATQNQVRVKQHQGEFNIPEDGFQLGKIPTQRSDGKSGSYWNMFGPDKNVKRTKGYQDSLATANQQPPPPVNVLPAKAPMDITNVTSAPPVQVIPHGGTMNQTSAENALRTDPFAETEVEDAEGGVNSVKEREKHEAALLADPYLNQNASATTHGLDKSTNPRRFVGVI